MIIEYYEACAVHFSPLIITTRVKSEDISIIHVEPVYETTILLSVSCF